MGTLALLLASLSAAAQPDWWITRVVISTNSPTTNDFAVASIGQVKWIAAQAKAELDAKLPVGCGSAISNLVAAFVSSNAQDYAAVNAGQLKNVATPFYDCLRTLGWPCFLPDGMTTNQNYPWAEATNQPNDYAVVNVGQVKYMFSFSLLSDTTPPVITFLSPAAGDWKAVLP